MKQAKCDVTIHFLTLIAQVARDKWHHVTSNAQAARKQKQIKLKLKVATEWQMQPPIVSSLCFDKHKTLKSNIKPILPENY